MQVLIFPPSGVRVEIVTGLILVLLLHQWKEVFRYTHAQGLPWLITAFGLVWIPHSGIELVPSLSFFPGMIAIVVRLGLGLCSDSDGCESCPREELHPKGVRLLIGFGLATTTGSAVILGASLLARIVWWMENQSAFSTQGERANNFIAGFNPIRSEAALG